MMTGARPEILAAVQEMAEASTEPDLDRLLARLLEITARATASDSAALFLLDAARDELVLAAHHPPNPLAAAYRRIPMAGTSSGSAAKSLVSIAMNVRDMPVGRATAEAAGVHEIAVVPLHVRGRPAGSLNLSRMSARPFVADDLRAAELLAGPLAVQVESASLYAEARRRVEELSLLLDVGRAVTASLELDAALDTSAEILARLLDASNCFIMLLDPQRTTLVGAASANPALRESFRSVRIGLDEPSIVARCVRARAPVAVADARTAKDVHRGLVERFAEQSLLALPLYARAEPIGAVLLDDTRTTRSWTQSEIERAELVANQIAVAVANARLFDDLKRSYADLARAQEELVKRERLAALGELAAVMAHEVRNPLGVIFNSVCALEKIVGPSADGVMLLGIVREEASRLNHLVADLLDFARPRAPCLQAESLEALIEGAIEAAATEAADAGLRVETEVAPALPPVYVDARMIRRAFVNLVLNGLQAMGKSGTLTVRASAEIRDGRPIVRVDVHDTGPGIAPEIAARLFQPFVTTKASGTGLGLAVVKSIVDSHRGELVVDTAPAGTTFSLLLPLGPAPSSSAPPDVVA